MIDMIPFYIIGFTAAVIVIILVVALGIFIIVLVLHSLIKALNISWKNR